LVHDLAQKADTEHQLRLVAESDAEYTREKEYMLEKSMDQWKTPASN